MDADGAEIGLQPATLARDDARAGPAAPNLRHQRPWRVDDDHVARAFPNRAIDLGIAGIVEAAGAESGAERAALGTAGQIDRAVRAEGAVEQSEMAGHGLDQAAVWRMRYRPSVQQRARRAQARGPPRSTASRRCRSSPRARPPP